MKASKEFKKENGDKYEVIVSLSASYSYKNYFWDIRIEYCPKGKRKKRRLTCEDDYKYRELDMDEREKYYKKFILSHIPAEWVTEVQMEIIKELSKPII